MLIYLIDGNNLYHAINSVCDAKEPRLALVDYLKSTRLTGSRTNEVVIVFDVMTTLYLRLKMNIELSIVNQERQTMSLKKKSKN